MRIITHGKFGKELAELYHQQNNPNIQIDYVENLTQKILDKYQAWAAFSPPKNFDISHIKWIHSFAAGVDPYTNRTDLNPNLILTKSVGEMDRKMAEYCLAQIMLDAQNCLKLYDNQKEKIWKRETPKMIKGKNVAILGTGFMGKGISKLLKSVGMKTIGVNRTGKNVIDFDSTISFNALLQNNSNASYIISTLPSTKNNYHLLDSIFFSKFNHAHFINCGRGDVVDSEALLASLDSGNIALASLDVFEQEPLANDSKFWSHPKIIITPHQAAITDFEDILESFSYSLNNLNNEDNIFRVNLDLGY